MTRPDVIVVTGRQSLIVSGDRAKTLLDACNVVHHPSFSGYQCDQSALPLLREHAAARGWVVKIHEPARRTT